MAELEHDYRVSINGTNITEYLARHDCRDGRPGYAHPGDIWQCPVCGVGWFCNSIEVDDRKGVVTVEWALIPKAQDA